MVNILQGVAMWDRWKGIGASIKIKGVLQSLDSGLLEQSRTHISISSFTQSEKVSVSVSLWVMSCLDCPCACSRIANLAVSPDVRVDVRLGHTDTAYQPLSRIKSESFALELRSPSMVSFEASTENYDVWSPLGSVCGGKGTVWVARHKPSNNHVALKIYELDKCEDEFELIQHEILMVKQLRHRNIIQYMASFIYSQQLWIVMPLLGYTSASRLVATHFSDGLPEPALALVIKDVLHGLSYLHSKRIIHRAVRGSHILIDSIGRVALSGLRHSTCIMDSTRLQKSVHCYPHQARYNLNWASPELLAQDLYGYSEKSDVYSVGIVVCELGNGEVPYRGIPSTLMLLEKLEDRVPYLYDASTCPQNAENGQGMATDSGVGGSVGDNLTSMAISQRLFTAAAHNFVAQALECIPENRPSAEDLLHHQFIRHTRKLNGTLPQFLHPVVPLTQQTEIGDTIPDLLEKSIEQMCINDEIAWDF
ncbi:STE20-related kinase adapter protein alpha isoform X1 [Procambarus clarkii]|uniref:STE20-related kinase adapter protein alpha isoform X1 n=1 Tax=Procambarus clarkii TaxID=6728 RepID=UPI001E671FD2|nr:STE20-related kinase adapter protein alpha-like isoform X2 [Procambarus clarkii]